MKINLFASFSVCTLLLCSCGSGENSRYASKDLQTFGLRGNVVKVVETSFVQNTTYGDYTESETIEFYEDGTIKFDGKIKRDENGYLSSYESGHGDAWQQTEWEYSPNGDVYVMRHSTIATSQEYHYEYDENGIIAKITVRGVYEEGGEYEIKTTYSVEQIDNFGNWTNVNATTETTIDGETETEYKRILRQITYKGQVGLETSWKHEKFSNKAYDVNYWIEWPESIERGNVSTIQRAIWKFFFYSANGGYDIKNAVKRYYHYDGRYAEDFPMHVTLSATIEAKNNNFVSYYCLKKSELYNIEVEFSFLNYDVNNDKILSFSDMFVSPDVVGQVLQNKEYELSDQTKFLLFQDSITFVVDEIASSHIEETVAITELKTAGALTSRGKALYNIKDVESVDDNSISKSVYESKDLQTFGLKGKVLKVVETEYRETDSNGNNSKYSFTETIDFTTGGTAKLEGTVVRDENGYLSSFESGDGGDGWQLKEWTYSSKGDVLVYKVDTYGGSRDYHYVYDDEGNITMALSQGMYEEGEEYEIKTNYTILEKDAKGNWTNMLVKIVETIEGEIQKPEYQRITRQITYQ